MRNSNQSWVAGAIGLEVVFQIKLGSSFTPQECQWFSLILQGDLIYNLDIVISLFSRGIINVGQESNHTSTVEISTVFVVDILVDQLGELDGAGFEGFLSGETSHR